LHCGSPETSSSSTLKSAPSKIIKVKVKKKKSVLFAVPRTGLIFAKVFAEMNPYIYSEW
jgi:hypothetical protein